jgi:hypothetical protein
MPIGLFRVRRFVPVIENGVKQKKLKRIQVVAHLVDCQFHFEEFLSNYQIGWNRPL